MIYNELIMLYSGQRYKNNVEEKKISEKIAKNMLFFALFLCFLCEIVQFCVQKSGSGT